MASIFSKIIAGEIPSYKIAEDDMFYVVLNIEKTSAISDVENSRIDFFMNDSFA